MSQDEAVQRVLAGPTHANRSSCVCGFVADAGVEPTSAAWHTAHRDAHLARFPNVDEGTKRTLAQMIAFAERGAFVGGPRC